MMNDAIFAQFGAVCYPSHLQERKRKSADGFICIAGLFDVT